MAGHLELMERRVRSFINESKKLRYYKTTTTADGASNGTSIISSNLTDVNDELNGAEVTLLSGSAEGKRRIIEDWTQSTGTLLFTNNAFSKQVLTSTSIEITERGTWSGADIKRWLIDSINFLAGGLPKEVLAEYITVTSVTPSPAGFAAPPANTIDILGIDIGNKPAVQIPFEERSRFTDDSYIDPTTDDSFVYTVEGGTTSGLIHFKPETNATVRFHRIAEMTDFDVNGNTTFPVQFHDAVILWTVGLCWHQNENPAQAREYFKLAQQTLAAKGLKMNLLSKQEKGA